MRVDRRPTWLLVLISTFVLSACYGPEVEQQSEELPELRTYDVPNGHSKAAWEVLSQTLQASVQLGPGDRLVVVARPAIHEGIETFIEDLSDLAPDVADPRPAAQSVTLTYWAVVGWPMGALELDPAAQRIEGKGYAMIGARGAKDFSPALEALADSEGSMEFALIEKLVLASLSGHEASLQGRQFGIVQQRAEIRRGVVEARILVSGRKWGKSKTGQYELNSEVRLEPGQFLVAGQVGYVTTNKHGWASETEAGDLTLYYVITAEIDE